LPAVEKVLQASPIHTLAGQLSPAILTDCARRAVATLREQWKKNPPNQVNSDVALQRAVQLTLAEAQQLLSPSLKRVINGTGVILHTGLGRALLPPSAQRHALEILEGYCNLEIDLATGERGDRTAHVEKLLCQLTGAEAACVVNNNAAAILLSLNTMAYRREVIISRGQLVEIGGAFRMPEVIRKSGAKMVEWEPPTKNLAIMLKPAARKPLRSLCVHASNYRVLGFTQVRLDELVTLGKRKICQSCTISVAGCCSTCGNSVCPRAGGQ
jgi:L-seryl-tRNA(Ser) seleniumtransferase